MAGRAPRAIGTSGRPCRCSRATPQVLQFMGVCFSFIDRAVRAGRSVLVHCLAGAHRAGTTGIAYLMHAVPMSRLAATAAAKRLRPVVDPFGRLGELLDLTERALSRERAAPPRAPAAASRSSPRVVSPAAKQTCVI